MSKSAPGQITPLFVTEIYRADMTGRAGFDAFIEELDDTCRAIADEDEAGQEVEYRIVGPDEFDAERGYMSMDAPLGRALMRKGIDDEVRVELPGGVKTYVIVSVRYEA